MEKKHQNRLFYWILIAGAIAWTAYLYARAAEQAPEPRSALTATCTLPDGTVMPIDGDIASVDELSRWIPEKMIDTTPVQDAKIKIDVPQAGHFKLMLSEVSAVYLSEKTSITIPFKGEPNGNIAVEGEAFFRIEAQDSGSLYKVTARPYADIKFSHGNVYLKTTGDSALIAMLTARGRLEAGSIVVPQLGPMLSFHIGQGDIPEKWKCLEIDPNYCPAFATDTKQFIKEPFEHLAKFLEDYYHLEVRLESKNLASLPVSMILYPRKYPLETICALIEMETGLPYKIGRDQITFFNGNSFQ